MSMKNSTDIIENRTRNLPPCSAVSQPTAPRRDPEKRKTKVQHPPAKTCNLQEALFLPQIILYPEHQDEQQLHLRLPVRWPNLFQKSTQKFRCGCPFLQLEWRKHRKLGLPAAVASGGHVASCVGVRQWRTEGGGEYGGVQPPPKFRRPSKIVPNSSRLWRLLKIAEFRMPTPQDIWKKGSKILKLPSVRNCFTLALTNKLVVLINSLKVPKITKILLYEMKFLLSNYNCFQNPWLGGLPPPDPRSLCPLSSTEFVDPPPTQFLGTPLVPVLLVTVDAWAPPKRLRPNGIGCTSQREVCVFTSENTWYFISN